MDAPISWQGHTFAGMETREVDGRLQYRGRCSCGHVEVWASDKDIAWAEIADHWRPLIEALIRSRNVDG